MLPWFVSFGFPLPTDDIIPHRFPFVNTFFKLFSTFLKFFSETFGDRKTAAARAAVSAILFTGEGSVYDRNGNFAVGVVGCYKLDLDISHFSSKK